MYNLCIPVAATRDCTWVAVLHQQEAALSKAVNKWERILTEFTVTALPLNINFTQRAAC